MPVTSAGKGKPSCSCSNMTAVRPRADKGFPGLSTARDVLEQGPVHTNLCSYRSAQPCCPTPAELRELQHHGGEMQGWTVTPALAWDSKAELHHCVLQ